MSRSSRLQSDRRAVSKKPARAVCHRYDEARAVACEQVGVAYGAVAVPSGRTMTLAEPQVDRFGREEGIRMVRVDILDVSHEINEAGDRRGFLPSCAESEARRDGYGSRKGQREIAQNVGQIRAPRP